MGQNRHTLDQGHWHFEKIFENKLKKVMKGGSFKDKDPHLDMPN